MTQEEARMAAAQILHLTHAVDNKVKEVNNKMDVVIKGTPTAYPVGHLLTYPYYAYVG